MKQLIIGIDGGTQEIFEHMPMPFVHRLFAESNCPKLEIDLLSRGWVEIISGKYARDTKAFYMVPQCDGTNKILFKYSLKELLANPGVKPIWEIPKCSVGVMNIPTTFPAPEVDGFFVSGAGGGVNKVDGIPPDLCHPKLLASELEQLGYEIDIRFGTAGIKQIDELIDRLVRMMKARKDAYLKLCQQRSPDFGFIVFRAPTVVQYLAMSEIESYIRNKRTGHAENTVWSRGFERLYGALDECIRDVMTACNADHFAICADHGAAAYRYRADTNRFLQLAGFQRAHTRWGRTAKNAIGSLLGRRRYYRDRSIDYQHSQAFGHWYLSGIFVNDQRRFGGPVSEPEVESLTDRICERFNESRWAKEFSIEAKPYRRLHPKARYSDHLPDIKLHCSDEIFVSIEPGKVVRPNPDFGPVADLEDVKGGNVYGPKESVSGVPL